jgi:hypothetical protein
MKRENLGKYLRYKATLIQHCVSILLLLISSPSKRTDWTAEELAYISEQFIRCKYYDKAKRSFSIKFHSRNSPANM